MIEAIIIEDEAVAVRNLKRMLRDVAPDITILDTFESVQKSVDFLSKNQPDLIFMDIHLSDGNSFQIFEKIEITAPIIFTTAYDQYTFKAFKQYSVDYILKPIAKEDLEKAIEKFKQHFNISKKSSDVDLQKLADLLGGEKKYKKRFLVQIGKRLKTVNIDEVAYFFTENKMTFLKTFENKKYPLDFSLLQLELEVNPENFFRINRKYFISSEAIEDIYYLSTTRLKINLKPPPESDIFVTIDKIAKFKRWLN